MLELILLLLGLSAVVAGGLWRHRVRSQGRRELYRSLASPSPAVRRAALEGLADGAIAPHAAQLLKLAGTERDVEVLDSLSRLVATHQWEPSDKPALAELRTWVRDYLSSTPAPSEPGPGRTHPVQPETVMRDVIAALREAAVHEIRLRTPTAEMVIRPVTGPAAGSSRPAQPPVAPRELPALPDQRSTA